jgi:hypothetical protein
VQGRPRGRSVALHPDGNRVVVAPVSESPAGDTQDKVVFVFDFFDELRRLAPAGK